jgi:hypothetical protein
MLTRDLSCFKNSSMSGVARCTSISTAVRQRHEQRHDRSLFATASASHRHQTILYVYRRQPCLRIGASRLELECHSTVTQTSS